MSSGERAQARSERKRSREKQRREDVNKQFADLIALLPQIETDEDDGKRLPYSSITNRVDLIVVAIGILERLHKVSTDRKHEIARLEKELEDAKKMVEDTAARLKEATLTYQQPPGGSQNQVRLTCPSNVILVVSCTHNPYISTAHEDDAHDGQPRDYGTRWWFHGSSTVHAATTTANDDDASDGATGKHQL